LPAFAISLHTFSEEVQKPEGINREAALAHVWGHERNILVNIAKVLATAYEVSGVKASKKGDAFKLQIRQAK
jgi:hypothetical protein